MTKGKKCLSEKLKDTQFQKSAEAKIKLTWPTKKNIFYRNFLLFIEVLYIL